MTPGQGRIAEVSICDIPVSMVSWHDVLSGMASRIEDERTGGYISITNTESMYHALRRPEHLRYIQNADYSLCDGVGVIAAGWFWGHRIPRLNGPILQLESSAFGIPRGW